MSYGTAVLFVAAAATVLGLAAGKPGQAQHIMTHSPHPDMPDAIRGKQGITHKSLLRSDLAGVPGQEVIVWDTEYAPRAINPRHYHPAAITFHVVSGTGIWQEEGKAPVTLKAGDTLFTPAGTTHSRWNPSHTEKLRFLEFIVGEQDKARALNPGRQTETLLARARSTEVLGSSVVGSPVALSRADPYAGQLRIASHRRECAGLLRSSHDFAARCSAVRGGIAKRIPPHD